MKGAEKHIYSINMVAFIIYTTGLQPTISIDEKGLLYFIFPKDDVKDSTILYRDGNTQVYLQRYLGIFKDLKNMIIDFRKNNNNEDIIHE